MNDEEPTDLNVDESEKQTSSTEDPGLNSASVMSYDDALELTGRGRFSYEVLAASCLIFNYSIIEMVAIGFIITPAECDLNLSTFQKSMVNSAIYIGIIVTSILWGEMSDRLGRRRVMLPCLFCCLVSSFCASLSTSFWPMFLFRTLTGCMISAPSAIVFVYLGELQASEFRDIAIAVAVTSSQVVWVFVPGVAWLIIPNPWSFNLGVLIRPWRVFMWTWALLGLAGAGLLFRLPESPSFLMIRKGPEAALPILTKMYRLNHKKVDDFPAKSLVEKHEHKSNIRKDLLQLMKPPMLKCYLLSHGCMFVTFAIANGLYIWLPNFMNEVLKNPSAPQSLCDLINLKYVHMEESDDVDINFAYEDIDVPDLRINPLNYKGMEEASHDCAEGEVNKYMYPVSIVIEMIALVPFLLVNIYIHKMNKTLIYAVMMFTNSTGLVLASVVPQISVAIVFFIIGLASGGTCSILSALAVEAFPVSLRGLAMCTMYTAGHIGAIIGTSVIGLMEDSWCYILFMLIGCVASGSALALHYLWPDLKKVRAEMEDREFTY